MDPTKVKYLCLSLFNKHGEKIFELINKEILTNKDAIILREIIQKELSHCKKMNGLLVFLHHKYFKYTIRMKKILNLYFGSLYILKKVVGNEGFSVCFIGADGSGKSTLSKDIQKWLSWKIDSKSFYLGSGDQYNSLLKVMKKNFQRLRKPVENNVDKAEKDRFNNKNTGSIRSSGKISLIKYIFTVAYSFELLRIAKTKLKTLKKINKYQKKGGIAILDRFPQVEFEGIYDGPKIGYIYKDYLRLPLMNYLASKEKKILANAIKYSPTIVFKLNLPPNVSIKRKPDHNLEEIKVKAEITKKLSFTESAVYNIDATQLYDNELLEVKRQLWEKISVH
ncbi:hypothetical protein QNH10_19925 [Sporosarcina thermotolerans]|nr:hypothetical protein [Sporosarcina thermotolerans]WHT48251.1 hypothetical protein QNH10_19925 [Sporosarcina thermotolerans]